LTKTGMVFGTPEYMSPEQAKGDKPDPRVDVYACGCILFEMVTGDVPFRADSFMGVLTKHLLDQVPRLTDRTTREDLPAGRQAELDGALGRDRDERSGTMTERAVPIDPPDESGGVSYHAPGVGAARERAQSRGGPRSPSPPPPEVAVRAPPKPVSAPPAAPPPPVLATAAPRRRAATPTPSELDATVPNPLDEPLHLPRRR